MKIMNIFKDAPNSKSEINSTKPVHATMVSYGPLFGYDSKNLLS